MTALLVLFVFSLAYVSSLYLLQSYTAGDQIVYRLFYESINGHSLSEAYALAGEVIDAREPLTIFILWIGSNMDIEKDYYISFFNAVFLVGLLFLLRKFKAGALVIFLLMSNYYVVVLLTSAERLKFAYVMLIMAGLLAGKLKYAPVLLSPLFHLQSFLYFPSLFVYKFYAEIRNVFSRKFVGRRALWLIVFSIATSVSLAVLVLPGVTHKVNAYLAFDRGPLALVNLVVLSVIALLATTDWRRMLLSISPCFPVVLLFGGERGNMVAITIVLWLLMQESRLRHPLTLVLLFYLSFKSISLVRNIIMHGDGFVLFSSFNAIIV